MLKKKALIFGGMGQDGFYLDQILRREGIESLPLSKDSSTGGVDVANFSQVNASIQQHNPDYIFHLAARSTIRHDAIFDNHQAISTGTLNILESARVSNPNCRVFLSGSAMQFVNTGKPINEMTEFSASSPYSVSRIQSVYAARYFRQKFGMQVYVGHFFNHDGPRRTAEHVNQKIVLAAKSIADGSKERLQIGSLSVRKEFNYAGDMMEAVWILANQNKVFEAVIGSGITHSIQDWVQEVFGLVDLNWKDHVDESKDFTPEYQVLVSDPQTIQSLGWKPKVSFKELAKMMVEAP